MTTTAASPLTIAPATRPTTKPRVRVEPTYLVTEVRRLLRNRKSLMFSLIMPVFMTASIGMSMRTEGAQPVGHGNLHAFILISMVLYGAAMAATSAGISVAVEMGQGWTRTLNLTPLRPSSYVATKAAAGAVLAGLSVVVVTAVGLVVGARAEAGALVAALVLAWASALLFAAVGLIVGLVFQQEAAGQVVGILMTACAFGGGLFIPLSRVALMIGRFTPLWGLNVLAHWPLTGQAELGAALVNVVVWCSVAVAVASWLFRRSTERV